MFGTCFHIAVKIANFWNHTYNWWRRSWRNIQKIQVQIMTQPPPDEIISHSPSNEIILQPPRMYKISLRFYEQYNYDF